MLRFLADENFNGTITRGVRRRQPAVDLVRVQDVGLRRAEDPIVLAWAAASGRVTLTHDVSTFAAHAYDRVAAGLPMPGVLEVNEYLPVGQAIEEILIVAECSSPSELDGRVLYLPLR